MWFKRSDGAVFSADEASASFTLMSKDGSFELMSGEPETDETETQTQTKTAPKKSTRKNTAKG